MRISIIFWEGYLEVSPTLINLIQYLSEKNDTLDVFIRDDKEFDLPVINTLQNDHVHFHRISSQKKTRKVHYLQRFFDYAYIYLGKLSDEYAQKLKRHFLQLKDYIFLSYFIDEVRKSCKGTQYDVAFCVDSRGLYIHRKSGMSSAKTVNVSLEIIKKSEEKIDWLNRLLKNNEFKYLSGRVDFTLIQDVFRWELYKRVNGITKDNYKLLLNSLRKGEAEKHPEKSTFFHDKFKLPADTMIVISAGMISEFVCSSKIAMAVGRHHFATPVKVIFHNRLQEVNDAYYAELRAAGNGNLLLSLDPVPFAEVYKVITSSHIGLVIYDTENSNENYQTVGAASGKLYQYMQYGLPVIASNNKGLRDIVTDNNIGVVIKKMDELPEAIEKIIARYDEYSTNSKKAFAEKYNLDIYLDELYRTL